jgi:hypothetical protein
MVIPNGNSVKSKSQKVRVYRSFKRGGVATLVKIAKSSRYSWKAAGLSMGGRRVAFFCARTTSQMSTAFRVPHLGTAPATARSATLATSRGDIVICK